MTATTLPSLGELLAWPEASLSRVRYLLALRRMWMGPLYRALRHQHDRAVDPVIDQLPATPYFVWLDRHIQDSMWAEVGRLVDARLDEIDSLLSPRDGDLGTLTELPLGSALPAYYTETDFHRQEGGIWRDTRGAAIYAMGARVVHVGRNDNLELHHAFAASIPLAAPIDVLDLACGFGKTTFALKARWPEATVHGLDLSAPCLRLGRRMATEQGLEIHWRQGAAEETPYPDGSFDVVTVTMALHELPAGTIHGVLREAHRVLRPGGVFVAGENRLTGDPLRDQLSAYHSDVIQEVYMEDFRDTDLAEHARAAGFAAEAKPWYPMGGGPESEVDTQLWFTPWALLTAWKES